MLVLSRGKGQKIVIGNDIVITVLDSSPNRVRLGIEAPAKTTIHRDEVYLTLVKFDEEVKTGKA